MGIGDFFSNGIFGKPIYSSPMEKRDETLDKSKALLGASSGALGIGLLGGALEESGGVAETIFASEGIFSGEGVLASIFRTFETGADFYWDYLIWQDITGNHHSSADDFKHAWDSMGATEREDLEHLAKAIKGHVFFNQQLKKHANKEGVDALHQQFQALQYNMPGEKLLESAHKKLQVILHPDKNLTNSTEATGLFQELQSCFGAIKVGAKPREAYEMKLSEKPDQLKELYAKISANDVEQVFEKTQQASRKLLGTGPMGKAQSWVEKLSGVEKAGLVVGALGLTAAAAYGVAKMLDNRKSPVPSVPPRQEPDRSFQGKINANSKQYQQL